MDKPIALYLDTGGGSVTTLGDNKLSVLERTVEAAIQYVTEYGVADVILVGDRALLEPRVKGFGQIKILHAPFLYDDSGRVVDFQGKEITDAILGDYGVKRLPRHGTTAHRLFHHEEYDKEDGLDHFPLGYISLGKTDDTLREGLRIPGRLATNGHHVPIGICIQAPQIVAHPPYIERRIIMDVGMTNHPDIKHARSFMRQLYYWAIMGRAYSESLGFFLPDVRFFSNGEGYEPKGSKVRRLGHQFLAEVSMTTHYEGQVEPPDIAKRQGKDGDVIVTDGYSGNLFLKTTAGAFKAAHFLLRRGLTRNRRARIGAAVAKWGGAFDEFTELLDKNRYSSIVLGFKKPVAKLNGNTPVAGIHTALHHMAATGHSSLIETLEDALAETPPFDQDLALEIINS